MTTWRERLGPVTAALGGAMAIAVMLQLYAVPVLDPCDVCAQS